MISKFFYGLRGHFQEHVAKYAVLATGALTAAGSLLGTVIAGVGADTPVGDHLGLVVGGIAVAGPAIVYMKNLGLWQMLDSFGTTKAPTPEDLGDEIGKDTLAVTSHLHLDGKKIAETTVREIQKAADVGRAVEAVAQTVADGDNSVHEPTDGQITPAEVK